MKPPRVARLDRSYGHARRCIYRLHGFRLKRRPCKMVSLRSLLGNEKKRGWGEGLGPRALVVRGLRWFPYYPPPMPSRMSSQLDRPGGWPSSGASARAEKNGPLGFTSPKGCASASEPDRLGRPSPVVRLQPRSPACPPAHVTGTIDAARHCRESGAVSTSAPVGPLLGMWARVRPRHLHGKPPGTAAGVKQATSPAFRSSASWGRVHFIG